MGVTIDNMTLSGNNLRGTEFLWLETEQTTGYNIRYFYPFLFAFSQIIVRPAWLSVCLSRVFQSVWERRKLRGEGEGGGKGRLIFNWTI